MDIRAFREGDEEGILALDRAVEEHPWNRRDLANWRWKYRGGNPAGEAIMYVAEHEGRIVAHFAGLPMRYVVGGEPVLGSHSLAMMVLPQWQNRGLIKFVADKVLADISSSGWAFTYGYPNQNAHALHTRLLGYEDVGMQRLWQRSLDGHEMDLSIMSASATSGLDFRALSVFGPEADALFARVLLAKDGLTRGAMVVRDAAFLNWRYMARPDVHYLAHGVFRGEELAGYCVLKLYRWETTLFGHFVDLFVVPGDVEAGRLLLGGGLRELHGHGCGLVNLWMQGSLFFQNLLREHGFAEVSSRPLICRFGKTSERLRPRLTPENWYFTMGDTLEIY